MINKSTNKKPVLKYDIDAKKFWSGVDIKSDDECWNWMRGKNTTGYGLFSVRNTDEQWERTGRTYSQVLAHRVAAAVTMDVERHDYVMHKCDNRLCCNPAHLQVGTALDNMLDAIAKGRHRGPLKMNNA